MKKLGIILGILLLIVCIGVDSWYLWLKYSAPERIVSTTFEGGMLTTADGTSKHIFEIEYYRNDDNSGVEMFGLKSNYFLDENKTNTYSQGIQYLPSGSSNHLKFDNYLSYSVTNTGGWQNLTEYHYDFHIKNIESQVYSELELREKSLGLRIYDKTLQILDYDLADVSEYNYSSIDNYETLIESANPLSVDTMLKIELGGEIYGMKFKGSDTPISEDLFMFSVFNSYTKWLANYYEYSHYYNTYNFNYFMELLYKSVKTSVKAGTNSTVIFEFGDMFDYYKYDAENQRYEEQRVEDTTKLVNDFKSYYGIKVTVHAEGASKATDSMFNAMYGSSTYNTSLDFDTEEYFVGKTVIKCTEDDFDFVPTNDYGHIQLKLKQEFVDFYSQYNNIVLDIEIDLDFMSSQGYTIDGFIENSFGTFIVNTSNVGVS